MNILAGRFSAAAVTAALVAVGGIVAGVVILSSSRADQVDLTSAELVPAHSIVYVGANTNLKSSQWVAAFDMVQRLGTDDPEGRIQREVEEGGAFDWEEDVVPFLGGNAAFFITRIHSVEEFDFDGGLIIRVKDPERAMAALKRVIDEDGASLERQMDNGREYFTIVGAEVDEPDAVAIIDGHLVLTFGGSLFEVFGVADGRGPSLASATDFKKMRHEVAGSFLVFSYVDVRGLIEQLSPHVAELALLEAAGVEQFEPSGLHPIAAVVGAKDGAFEAQVVGRADTGSAWPAMLRPRSSKLASAVPADTMIYFSTFDLRGAWEMSLEQAPGGAANFDAMLEAFAPLIDFEDALDLFGGETSVALWLTGGDDWDVALLTEVEDDRDALATINRLRRNVFPGVQTRAGRIGGAEAQLFERYGRDAGYLVRDGVAAFGTADGLRAVFERSGPSLAELDTFQQARRQLPTSLGTFTYLDLRALLGLSDDPLPPELHRADDVPSAVIVNSVAESGGFRLSAVMTLEPD